MDSVYYLLFSVLIISSFLESFGGKKLSKSFYFSIVAFMILVAGLSFDMSPDWVAYFDTFRITDTIEWSEISLLSLYSGMESGFLAYNKLLTSLGLDFGFLTLSFALVSLLLKSSTFYKYGGYPFLVLLLYAMPNYFFEDHIHIRQGLATGIAIYSTRYAIDRKFFKFLLLIAIGYQIHESIIVFILAYWIINIKINSILIGWIVLFSIIGYYTGLNSIIEIIMQYMPIGKDKFESYQSELYAESGVAIGDFVKILSTIAIIMLDRYVKHDKLYIGFRNLFISGTILYFFLGKGIFGIRLPGYYLAFYALTVGRILYSFNGNNLKKILIYFSFMTYLIALMYWFQVIQGENGGFRNYKSFFNPYSNYGLWRK